MRDCDFPVLDAPRHNDFNRTVIAECGIIDAYLEELDNWCSLPVRLVTDQASGCHLEIGPYGLDIADIAVLRTAIAAYDQATGGCPERFTK